MKKYLTSFILLIVLFSSVHGQSKSDSTFHSIEDALKDPTNVKSLDLSEKNLIELPVEILQLKNLEDIDLEANPKLDFGKTLKLLSKLNNLKMLGLGRNELSHVPISISYFKNLEYLGLEDNKFTDIPKSVRKLKIKTLYLFSNNIKKLNLKNGDLLSLQDINLCYNKFKRFPIELAALPELKQITIWYNNIHLITTEISKFKNIDSINMDNNDLCKIPLQFALLKKLHHLSIRNNHLTSKSVNAVYHIMSLKSLGLDGNNILTISPQIKNLKNLTYFNISSNPVRNLPSEFTSLKKLKVLGLNDLPELDWIRTFSLLASLPELRMIGMSGIRVKIMPVGFEKLTQVRSFWLPKNSMNKEEHERIKKLLPNVNLGF
ncbi:MAG: leucine-rich repeat domain-containing protein [Bacteroidota bacterium]